MYLVSPLSLLCLQPLPFPPGASGESWTVVAHFDFQLLQVTVWTACSVLCMKRVVSCICPIFMFAYSGGLIGFSYFVRFVSESEVGNFGVSPSPFTFLDAFSFWIFLLPHLQNNILFEIVGLLLYQWNKRSYC